MLETDLIIRDKNNRASFTATRAQTIEASEETRANKIGASIRGRQTKPYHARDTDIFINQFICEVNAFPLI